MPQIGASSALRSVTPEAIQVSGSTLANSAIKIDTRGLDHDAALFAEVEQLVGMPIREFAMKFDTLGESCEFGFVQRRCGAEPLSLMRFAGTTVDRMADALDRRFSGLGERILLEGKTSWDVRDLEYNIMYHTFRSFAEASEKAILTGEPRRLRFLGDKLLADVAGGEKVFLCWRPVTGLTKAQVARLHESVRRLGAATTLVFLSPGHEQGAVEALGPGLFHGHVRKLADPTMQGVPDVRGWLEMMVNAWLLRARLSAPPAFLTPSANGGAKRPVRGISAWFGNLAAWRDRRRVIADLRAAEEKLTADVGWKVQERLDEALVALERRDVVFAALQWEKAVGLSSKLARSSDKTVQILSGINRAEEAEVLMQQGMAREPKNPVFAEGFAEAAARCGRTEEAIRRYEEVRRRFPRRTLGYSAACRYLRNTGRAEEAEAVSSAGIERVPADIVLRFEHAFSAELREDWQAALERWTLVLNAFGHHLGVLGSARALQRLGRLDEADRMLCSARYTHPLEAELAVESALIARLRRDRAEELERWAYVRRRFPKLRDGYEQGYKALIEAGDAEDAEVVAALAREHLPDLKLDARLEPIS